MFQQKLKAAQDAISALFSEISVPRNQTRDALQEIREEIDALLETLKDD